MNIPPKDEDVVAQLEAERELHKLATETLGQFADENQKLNADLAALREELDSLRETNRLFAIAHEDSRNHVIKIERSLTVAEQLLRRVIACGELTRINHSELEADVCKWLEPVTPAEPVTFGHEYNNLSVAERSAIQVTARIQEVTALKPAEEGKGS